MRPTKSDNLALAYLSPEGFAYFRRETMETGRQRIGQAWFNALSPEDQNLLTGTMADPFYKDDWESVLVAWGFILGSKYGQD